MGAFIKKCEGGREGLEFIKLQFMSLTEIDKVGP